MITGAIQPHVSAAALPPERLAGNSNLSEQQKIAEASRQFEAILLRQILDSTQKTVIPSTFSDNSASASIYRDMITNQLAESISKSGAFGLTRMFEHQLSRPAASTAAAGSGTTPGALPTMRSDMPSGRPPLDGAESPPVGLPRRGSRSASELNWREHGSSPSYPCNPCDPW